MKKVMGAGGCFCCAGGGCACPNSAAVPSAKRVTAFIFPPGSDLARSLLRFPGARHNYSVPGNGRKEWLPIFGVHAARPDAAGRINVSRARYAATDRLLPSRSGCADLSSCSDWPHSGSAVYQADTTEGLGAWGKITQINMPLSPGTRLGPYEILTPVGAGGMGEVYRARDTRLDRTIAIKVLPP